MAICISPWTYKVSLTSPDGRITAAIDDAGEVGMGAPTSGTLYLSNGNSYPSCNPSIVWSDDSRYLAAPQWTFERDQRLMVISLENETVGYATDTFWVIELHAFLNGIISGTDSPIYKPRRIEIWLDDIQWE